MDRFDELQAKAIEAGMSRVQADYAIALALVETNKDERKKRMEPYKHLIHRESTDAEVDEYFAHQVEIEQALRFTEAQDILTKAEDALLEWGKALLEEKFPERAEELLPLWDKPIARQRLIKIVFLVKEEISYVG